MNRRDLLKGAIAAGVAGSTGLASAAESEQQQWLVLEWFRSRNDMDVSRLRTFLSNSMLPAFSRANIRPVGLFQPTVGPDSPAILMVSQFASTAAMDEARRRMGEDKKFWEEMAAFDEKSEPAYEGREAWLLRAFSGHPAIEIPKVESGKTNLFELRMYESPNTTGHIKKVDMFNHGEIDIFRRCGIHPVFFGSTVFGSRIPNLVYMICFPSWQARDDAWAKFRVDPEWKKMSSAPENSNRALVSRITNQLLTPLPASQIL